MSPKRLLAAFYDLACVGEIQKVGQVHSGCLMRELGFSARGANRQRITITSLCGVMLNIWF
jgi:hypothetical protein